MSAASDRLQSALRGVNQALNPRQVFAMTWEYTVIDATPGPPTKIDCQVVDGETSAHLPQQLTQLVLWPGPSGIVAVPQPGSIVRIGFVNGDPTKPFVAGLDPNGTPLMVMGFVELTMQLGDASAQPLAQAQWITELTTALTALASGLAALTTPPLTPVGTVGTAFGTALGAVIPAPTIKVLGS
jgi:hypothetical protein